MYLYTYINTYTYLFIVDDKKSLDSARRDDVASVQYLSTSNPKKIRHSEGYTYMCAYVYMHGSIYMYL
jgi:hypothetical protein